MADTEGMVRRCRRPHTKNMSYIYGTAIKRERERVELYGQMSPPGNPIPINVDHFPIVDNVLGNTEIRDVVHRMRNARATGALEIQAEHM